MIDKVNGTESIAALLARLGSATQRPDPFSKADTDGNGSLDKTEVQSFLDVLSEKTGMNGGAGVQAEAAKVFSVLDTNEDGVVDAGEFAAGRERLRELLGLPQEGQGASSRGGGVSFLPNSLPGSYGGKASGSSLLSTLA